MLSMLVSAIIVLSILVVVLGIVLTATVLSNKLNSSIYAKNKQKLQEVEAECEHAKVLLEESSQAMDKLNKKFEAQLSANSDLQNQREQAWELYQTAGLRAGNAQQMLMRSLGNAIKEVNNYRSKEGKKLLKIDPRLQELVDDYQEQHVKKTA